MDDQATQNVVKGKKISPLVLPLGLLPPFAERGEADNERKKKKPLSGVLEPRKGLQDVSTRASVNVCHCREIGLPRRQSGFAVENEMLLKFGASVLSCGTIDE